MFELASLATGLIGGIGKLFSRGKANKEMRRLEGQDPSYTANPIVQQRYDLARTLLNARMPGAARAERNIYANQANAIGQVGRNATDSSQALALGAGILGQSNNAFGNLADQEANDYQRRYGNLMNAEDSMINESDKVYQDTLRRFSDKVQFRGAQSANRANNWGDISNMGFGLADFGASGGFDNLFGGKKRQNGIGGLGTALGGFTQ